ncbi:hypothetical protein [Shewanella psychromarinicola]|uniref:Uncharacterized protein n=1 Tax=Shewanella psychromarinicola TaxID=2487742 RepID=A0A3N4DBD2_9GAMM|nr:hypothetical protein [Shewanella psychromarinicola]AZG34609.1 hypothetical protein EGC80_06525 [Shewanella psychromarinicola]MCL1083730.1 hypothetical protein [Shewanella psychromarinicola]RPA22866.1 hypothetical protein EGC77_20205 [Shewanella psychromarinicola]
MRYVYFPSSDDIVVGYSFEPEHSRNDFYYVKVLVIKPDYKLKWYDYKFGYQVAHFKSYKEIIEFVDKSNLELDVASSLDSVQLDGAILNSIKLKIEKEVTRSLRLANEEQLMLSQALLRNQNYPRPNSEDLIVKYESSREPLMAALSTYPYTTVVSIPKYKLTLFRYGEYDWTTTKRTTQKELKLFHRAKIAEGFGIKPDVHWGRAKAEIRNILLPRANKLLQLAGVKRMLDDALREGKKVLVCGGFIFWYEDNLLEWQIKSTPENSASDSMETIWHEGTIVSKNHGRIVVLPHIKSCGEKVNGYTKNAPNDGEAIKRHTSDYVELPFEVLKGDLMFDLFGELKYE